VTKQEAESIMTRCHEYVGDYIPDSTIMLDGHFTVEQLEAVIVLMKTATTEDPQE
jgi:hypothetical protein